MPAQLDQLAQHVARLLGPADWGIGGSYLLYCHGLVQQAQDLDLVCSPQFFPTARSLLLPLGRELAMVPHPEYCSQHFCRIQTVSGVIELMAGIQVRRQQQLHQFVFDPLSLQFRHGLPLMQLADWLQLYQLFDRPQRVALLEQHLTQNSSN
ncbi:MULTISPECIES: hypothetical protein [Rheinheimera]|uniref:Nucleotidyltransferase family protein n=1 Tax=Rheinheimera marina TaxID=1774958 RepID=A0ABV9JPX1_9GAMM